MNHALLVAFLRGEASARDFGRQIADEVVACQRDAARRGVGHVIISDGPETVVTREHARRLLRAMADGQLSVPAAIYTADCLIMSDAFDFADRAVADALYFIADESRPPTPTEIAAALAQLER